MIINDQFERGGAGRVTAILCNGLKEKGYDVVVVADIKNWHNVYSIDCEIPIFQINTKDDRRLIKWLNCLKLVRKYIREEKPDIIIAVQSIIYLISLLANYRTGIPLIAVDHTSFDRKIHPLIDFIRYHLYGRAEGLSILTQKDYRLLRNKYQNKRVIYNPLPFPILRKGTDRKNNILCVGRFEAWYEKGFDLILDIWKNIEHDYPNWTLDIAGSGDIKARNTVLQLINERGLEKRVKILGYVDNMIELYEHTSIFALPSRIEGFPMSLLEAMSQGCACIAFSINGVSEEMLESNSGIIVKDGDITTFQQSLISFIEDRDKRNRFSLMAPIAVERFSIDSFIEEWIKFILDINHQKVEQK